MGLGLSREQVLELLKSSDLTPEVAKIIAETIERNNKVIEENLDRHIHNVFISRMRFKGQNTP